MRWLLSLVLLLSSACRGPGDEIVICGETFRTGTSVVLWTDPGGYDAYQTGPRFSEPKKGERPSRRYGSRQNLSPGVAQRARAGGWSLADLKETVHLFVLHYDASGTSRRCFETLQDRRKLSVHFMLDVDGTIYQTLDLKERAWHATIANNHSIGIEIAHPGAFPQPGHPAMRRWYDKDDEGVFMKYPKFLGKPGVRDEDYIPRPARPGLLTGKIHERAYWQHDFTDAQYEALAHLAAALSRVFPKIELDYPIGPAGRLFRSNLSPDALHAHNGLVGHFHVQRNKRDPGPAFDWNRVIDRARELR
jgi:N-acetyl-anhydromuramyl-L-alanine amidase AmpD